MSRRRNSAIGTRAYTRTYRTPLVARLLAGQTINCAARRSPRCLTKITKPSQLVIGHIISRSHGGTDHPTNLQPECRPCSDHEGGTLRTTQPQPSRNW